jgi:hypothetical protein
VGGNVNILFIGTHEEYDASRRPGHLRLRLRPRLRLRMGFADT